jgi:exodeoxyribonuclease VII large subunit
MKTPTISAIGHETDFTILDFVADIRAATPTAAAEIATPNIQEVLVNVENHANRMKNKLIAKFDFYNEAINRIKSRNWFTNPEMLYVNKHLLCNSFEQRLNDSTKSRFMDLSKTLEKSKLLMKNSLINIKDKKKHEYFNLVSTLDALSPLKVINRGYSITEKDGKTVNSVKQVQLDDKLSVKLKDGTIVTRVISKEDN